MIPPHVALQLVASLLTSAAAVEEAPNTAIEEHVFVVSGMNCPVCPHMARHALGRLEGVEAVASSPNSRRVVVRVRAGGANGAAMMQALAGAGFRAREALSTDDGKP